MRISDWSSDVCSSDLQKLVFIDGDDKDQMSWALRRFDDQSAKLIMVTGAPLDAMTLHQRRFYFDQGGFLVGRFGIRAVPAVVAPNGRTMKVYEIPLGVGRKCSALFAPRSGRACGDFGRPRSRWEEHQYAL